MLPLQLERFHDRVMQVTFSTPGVKAPTDTLNDDGLIEALKRVHVHSSKLLDM